MTQMTSNSCYI